MTKRTSHLLLAGIAAVGVTIPAITFAGRSQTSANEHLVPVAFVGGYDTDRRDGGQPVLLVAAGLGIPTDVFRRAFSGVTPARNGPPEPEQVHRNKDALLAVLAPYGITNDRLDEVSDFYRYQPQRGELWRHSVAQAYAVVLDGKIVRFKVTSAGYGYSSAPRVSVPGFPGASPKPSSRSRPAWTTTVR